MKKSFYLLLTVFLCFSCGGNKKAPKTAENIEIDTTIQQNAIQLENPTKTPEELRMDSLINVALKTDEPITVETIVYEPLIPMEQDEMWRDRLNIIYNQSVEGYSVKVTLSPRTLFGGADPAPVMMEFHNEHTKAKFYVFNPSFTIHSSNSSFWTRYKNNNFKYDETVYLDFEVEDYGLPYHAPFGFLDIDFDGEKELLINNWGAGQRGCSIYDIYKIRGNTVQQLTNPPFDRIDDLCKLNHEDKVIIVHSSGGAQIWINEYYRCLPNGQFELYRVEGMDFPYYNITEKR